MMGITKANRVARAFGMCCMVFACAAFSSAPETSPAERLDRNAPATSVCQGGYVHEVSALVSIQRPGAKMVAARVGDQFESETLFRTGPDDEETVLKFADGQIVALGADTVFRVGRYCYLANNLAQSGTSMELIKGQMRVVAGLIAASDPEKLRIVAGNSTVSIERSGGADFMVAVNPDPQEFGYALVQAGRISVRTPYGRISRIDAGQYAPWQPGRSPSPPIPFAAAPAVIQANAAGLLASVLPSNTPADIVSAAKSASAVAAAAQTEVGATPESRLVGYVHAATNAVSVKRPFGTAEAANVGLAFEAGTRFDTGAEGRVVLKFADGQLVVLGPSSALTIGRYQFDPGDVKASESALELTRGAMRIVAGSIHAENRGGLNVSAGASIVDILNPGPADFIVSVSTQGREVGVVQVTLGEIAAHTPYGPIDKVKSGQSRLWGPRDTPETPISVATSLGVVKAAVALQLSGLPDTAPVAVAETARAVAAAAAAAAAQAAASANAENPRLQAEAQTAAELANLAMDAAASASEALAAKRLAAQLETLAPTAAGEAVAQAPPAPGTPSLVPIIPAVTPGAAGGCLGSKC